MGGRHRGRQKGKGSAMAMALNLTSPIAVGVFYASFAVGMHGTTPRISGHEPDVVGGREMPVRGGKRREGKRRK